MEAGVGVAPRSALLSRSFTDAAAIARALTFSLSDNAHEPPPPPPAAAFTHGAGNHPPTGGAASPARPNRLGPAGGRAGKRRPRPSKRAPTTYISTDAATFRIMVQRVTGADEEGAGPRQDTDHLGLGLLLPHFGVVGPSLLPPDPAAAYTSIAPAAEQQPLFPTLDSWNVMYGKNVVG